MKIKKFYGSLVKPFWKISRSVMSDKMEEGIQSKTRQLLIEEARAACKEWANANSNFDNAETEELVDYYTYSIKAAEKKIEYYLKKIKES